MAPNLSEHTSNGGFFATCAACLTPNATPRVLLNATSCPLPPASSGLHCCRRPQWVCHPQDSPHPRRRLMVAKLSPENEDLGQWFPGVQADNKNSANPGLNAEPWPSKMDSRKPSGGCTWKQECQQTGLVSLPAPSFGVVDGVSGLVQGRAVGQVSHVVREHSTRQWRASSMHKTLWAT